MKTPDRKGQLFLTDFIAASIIFLFILTITIMYTTDTTNRLYLLEREKGRQLAAITAANALTYSPGQPSNWENLETLDSVSSIGLAESPNEISEEKLQRLADLNSGSYEKAKELLGTSRYGLRVSVLDLLTSQSIAEFGLEPLPEQKTTAVNRIALYNGQEVVLRVKVFE